MVTRKDAQRARLAAIAIAAIMGHTGAQGQTGALSDPLEPNQYLSPIALTAARDGKALFIACAGANRVLEWDTPGGEHRNDLREDRVANRQGALKRRPV